MYGDSYDEPGFGANRPTAGKKRPNPEEEAALKEAMADFDYQVGYYILPFSHLPYFCLI